MEGENGQEQGHHHFTNCDVTISQDAAVYNYAEGEVNPTNTTNSARHQHNYFISEATITNCVTEAPAEGESRRPTPVIRFRQPNSNLLETKTYRNLQRVISNPLHTIQILQCHGLPGSGKSQTVRKLAQNFPFSQNISEVLIKWHIQCKDSGHEVKQKLEKLAEEMRRHFLLEDDQEYQTIVQDLSDGIGSSLVDTFRKSNVPVLLIIEDPDVDPEGKKLLIDIFRKMKREEENHLPPFHIYITSRVENPVFPKGEDLGCYKKVQVQGFDREEALRFLEPDESSEADLKAAEKIFERLTGSPLGLCAAKRYRDDSHITYSIYLDLLKDCEYEINRSERDAILEEFGTNAEHIFQALAMPFRERAKSDEGGKVLWKLLCCISYLHYDDIPRYVIGKFFEKLQKNPIKNRNLIFAESGRIMTIMQEYSMGTISSDKESITIHEVVQNAFKLSVAVIQKGESKENFYPLTKAVEVMCGLVTKDVRRQKNFVRMHKIQRHVQSLLENVEKDDRIVDERNLLNRALVSHLYEITAAIMLKSPELSEECERYFHRALELTWGKRRTSLLLKHRDENKPMISIARSILEESENLTSNMPDEFVLDYESKLWLHFSEFEINFLQKKCGEDFKSIHEAIKNNEAPRRIIHKLRNKKLFLTAYEHRPIFYAERVATVLHSWSRWLLHTDATKAANMHCKYTWLSKLSCEISREINRSHNIPLLVEEISTCVMTALLVKQKDSLDETKGAKEMCEKALMKDSGDKDFYENGLLKQHDGAAQPTTQIYHLKNLIRSNGRLMKTCRGDLEFIKEADKSCERLFELANSNAKCITNAAEAMIYCGKYYASKKEFDKALDCFQRFFDVESTEGRGHHFSRRCWAVFNFTRAVCCNRSRNLYARAKELCQDILGSNESMAAGLNKLVREQLTRLNSLT